MKIEQSPIWSILLVILPVHFLGGGLAADLIDGRAQCNDARCRRIEAFVRARYCDKAPWGEGPEDSCSLKIPERPGPQVRILADFTCTLKQTLTSEKTLSEERVCKQVGTVASPVRDVLVGEMRKLGLSGTAQELLLRHWAPTTAHWSLVEAYYERLHESDLEVCHVIGTFDRMGKLTILRKVPFVRADRYAKTLIDWVPLDVEDADGDGQPEVILLAQGWEDHWIEVVSVGEGSPRTLFAGLGYYL